MGVEWGLGHEEQNITSVNLTYTGESTALPTGPDIQDIFMIEDITDSDNPRRLNFISTNDLERNYYSNNVQGFSQYSWARLGDNIALRPNPASSVTLRIWYIRAPYVFNLDTAGDEVTATDQHPWPPGHEELVVLGAARRLMRTDSEIPPYMIEDYAVLWGQFVRAGSAFRGPRYVRNARRFIS